MYPTRFANINTDDERKGDNKLATPIIRKGDRWLLYMQNSEGIRVEFTEY